MQRTFHLSMAMHVHGVIGVLIRRLEFGNRSSSSARCEITCASKYPLPECYVLWSIMSVILHKQGCGILYICFIGVHGLFGHYIPIYSRIIHPF